MADETNAATAPETVIEPEATAPADAPSETTTETTSPTPGTETEGSSAVDAVSDADLELGRLLLESDPDAPADETTETPADPKPAAQPRKPAAPQKPAAAEPAQAGSFDYAGLTSELVEEFGASAKPAVTKLVSRMSQQDERNDALAERLEQALATIEDLGGKVKPLAEHVQAATAREVQAEIQSVHEWFDERAKAGYADRYGVTKDNPDVDHNPGQQKARKAIYGKALHMVRAAKADRNPIPMTKALAMAEAITFGQPTKAGAVDAVRGQVKQAARGLSVDPARGGKTSGPLTPVQEHEKNVKHVAAILARASSGDRK